MSNNPDLRDIARGLIGNFIRERRTQLGWSQEKLSDLANIRRVTVTDVEAGRNYNMNTLLAILGAMRGHVVQIEWKDIESIPHFGTPEKN